MSIFRSTRPADTKFLAGIVVVPFLIGARKSSSPVSTPEPWW